MKQDLRPFYMWAGGKTRLIKSYANVWPDMSLFDVYAEPFFGGGAVFCWMYNTHVSSVDDTEGFRLPFSLFTSPQVSPGKNELSFKVGDSNAELMGLLNEVRDNPSEFIASTTLHAEQLLALGSKNERKEWYYSQRMNYWDDPSPALLYVLMRAGFNGIWQTCVKSHGLFATPAGLLNQTRVTQLVDSALLWQWHTALSRASLHTGSYETFTLPKGQHALVYLDPPYRDSYTTYSTGFSDEDQHELTEWFREQALQGHTVIMSNRCVEGDSFFEDRLGDIASFYYIDVIYTAGRRKATEGGFVAKPAQELLIVSHAT